MTSLAEVIYELTGEGIFDNKAIGWSLRSTQGKSWLGL